MKTEESTPGTTIVMEDLQKATEILSSVEKGASDACQQIQTLLDQAKKGKLQTSKVFIYSC